MSQPKTEDEGVLSLQQQFSEMQKLMEMQMKAMKAQADLLASHHQSPSIPHSEPATDSQIIRNVKVPEGRYSMSLAEFRTYRKDCLDYKKLTKYNDEQIVIQIRLSMDVDLKRAIDTNYGDKWNTFSVEHAVRVIGELINHISNSAVYRKEFDHMNQLNDEPIREYVTRLKACAIDCNFVCPHNERHDLTDYHIINRIRSGIYDKSLQQEILAKSDTIIKLTDLVQYCETYESAKKDKDKLNRNSQSQSNLNISGIDIEDLSKEEIIAAISNYKRNKRYNDTERNKCRNCGLDSHSRANCPAQGKECKKCGKRNHFERVCRSKPFHKHISSVIIGAIDRIINSNETNLPEFFVDVKRTVDENNVKIKCIPDTGAQVTVAGPTQLKEMNIEKEQLTEPSHILKHAGGNALTVIGSKSLIIEHNGQSAKTEVYFANGVKTYLSFDVCKKLKLVHENFPHVNIATNNTIRNGLEEVPNRPDHLPYPPTIDNIRNLENWFLKEFSSTTFNVNQYPLPLMSGPKQRIHLKPNATPHACHTPIPIPHHWKQKVKEQLDQDEELGIIRKAPVGVATEWCMRMITVPKKDGSPRRTIDFQPINKHCQRETHHTPNPYDVVSNIPQKSYKTALDAYNGYHQVPLDDESINLTTFITEYGRYQYLRSPQGHISSGDAYTRRYDDIIADVPRKKKVVDDVLLYDDNIETAFYHVFDYLVLCYKNGITINPKKFKFAKQEIDFVGYHIGWISYRPSDEMLAAIRDFPMPTNPTISDIRSWFGLINQIAPFIASASIMEPFRELLQPTKANSKKVFWDSQLKGVFEKTKLLVTEHAEKGLTYYDCKKETILITDWSRQGIGFVILQKSCSCLLSTVDPLCCENGWKIIYCNSRQLSKAEQNYAPIEGEALAVKWALKKARMFLLGSQFHIIVDHQPLLKIFGDKSLSDISNNRLLTFKEATMQYSFTMHYIKGIKNFADVFSRYPVGQPDSDDLELSNSLELASVDLINNITSSSLSITVEIVKEAAREDEQYQTLLSTIRNDSFAKSAFCENPIIKDFYNVRDRLSIVNDLVMYGFEEKNLRVVIPKKLQHQMLLNLHIANQGATSMLARARKIIYWPGIDRDITSHALSCMKCKEISPSQQKEPLISTPPPEYPFQQAVTDLFEFEGHYYLVYTDRLTGFIELAYFPGSTVSSTIISTFREFFHRWGVPEEISLDGGPNLVSNEVKNWLKKWGVTIRLSSAYYPQSNGRAEAAVKSIKRLINGNTGNRGSINTDQIAQALLQHRNTPLRDINLSPAQLALGRELRDTMPLPRNRYKVDKRWSSQLQQREKIMLENHLKIEETYNSHAKSLPELQIGTRVLCQNMRSMKWDRSGTIVEAGQYRQYFIKLDGSGRITLRNRRHIRKILVEPPITPIVNRHMNLQLNEQNNQNLNHVTNNTPDMPRLLRRSKRTRRPPLRYRDNQTI